MKHINLHNVLTDFDFKVLNFYGNRRQSFWCANHSILLRFNNQLLTDELTGPEPPELLKITK